MLLSSCLCDEAGLPVFTKEQAARLPNRIAQPLLEAINRINGFNADSVEDAEKN
jgi:hypothetical protein